MARKKSANSPPLSDVLAAGRKQEDHPAEEESQETPEQEAANDNFKLDSSNGQNVSKADAVRQAMAAGMESPGDGVAYIKTHFGIDLPKPMWSSYRAQIKAREAKLAGGEIQPRQRRTQTGVPQQFSIPPSFGDDIKMVKELVEAAGGADQFKEQVNSIIALNQKYGTGLMSLIDVFA